MMNNHERIAKWTVWSAVGACLQGIKKVEWFGRIRRGQRGGSNKRSSQTTPRSNNRLFGVRYKRLKQRKIEKSQAYAGLANGGTDNDEFVGDESSSEDEVTALFNDEVDSDGPDEARISELKMKTLGMKSGNKKKTQKAKMTSSLMSLRNSSAVVSGSDLLSSNERLIDFDSVDLGHSSTLSRHDSVNNMLSNAADSDDDLIDV
jgi:hypothetical protein